MSSSFLKATAVAMVVVSVLATTAEAAFSYYIPTPATPDFLLSPIFLWVTANVIIVWLVSSSRRRGRAANDDTVAPSSAAHDGEFVPGAVENSFYASSSEYEAFSDAAPSGGRRADDAVPSGGRRADDAPVSSKRLTREARAAARRSDRPRVRKKPAVQDAPTTPPWAVVADARDETAHDERHGQALEETAPAVSVDDDEGDVSLDSLWASIVQRRAARPVVVQKSESWGNEELPRLQRVAETAAAAERRQVRKSVSAVAKASAAPTPPAPSEPSAAASRQMGWRTRDVLITISPDELLRRAESFIRRQREHLRLQRQESEQRQLLLQRRLHAPAPPAPLIRV
ncbi:unnamed protein product [Miscanthus lutarioriparius]|uniref:Uncharacterized protein n=1 Tax=Miscanthus lutarioriparius TaxID=422564 RepID=A0A811M9N6_9POAL|nr:unnamed protein product [Miscanthus lutarioriparius]